MIDKMIEKLDKITKESCVDESSHGNTITELRGILLSAKPEWEAMEKRVEALEERERLNRVEFDVIENAVGIMKKPVTKEKPSEFISIPRDVAEKWVKEADYCNLTCDQKLYNAIKQALKEK